MPKTTGTFIFLLSFIMQTSAQQFIPLWPAGKMPNSKGQHLEDIIVNERPYQVGTPGMYAFFPAKEENNGAAVLILPGGSYDHLALDLGGFQIAKWMNSLGVSAFVVMYRLPTSPDLNEREAGPLQDAQRAMRIVRSNSSRWRINKDKIGVQGSSAGGHLATLLGNSTTDISSVKDEMDTISYRPDFMILVSPVIDLGTFAHTKSRNNFLGINPSQDLINKYSTQNNVNSQTPVCFIAHAFNDKTVLLQNSLMFYEALVNKHISASIHVFPYGGHSIGMINNPGSTELWKQLCDMWLKEMGITSTLPSALK